MSFKYLHTLPQTIRIPKGESWVILDQYDGDNTKTIILEEKAKLAFYSARTAWKLQLSVIHRGGGSISDIRCGFSAGKDVSIECKIRNLMEADDTESRTHILSLAESGWDISLDTNVQIASEDSSKISHHVIGILKERHIFLGSTGQIRAMPALIVHSDDVQTSHALAIERISDEELFYLRSRGFPREEAMMVMIDGATREIFSGLETVSSEKYVELISRMIDKIK